VRATRYPAPIHARRVQFPNDTLVPGAPAAAEQALSGVGGALAGPVVGYMAIRFGWRWAFVAIMLLGLVFESREP